MRNSSIRMERWLLQSKEIFSCSLPGKRSISMASNSIARRTSPPRSSKSEESGPANSTRISGRSQSRSSGSGGSTVILYFRRRPPCFTMPVKNSLILLAAAILSGIGIRNLFELFLARAFGRNFAHLATQTGAVHYCLLNNRNQIAFGVVKIQASRQIEENKAHHQRHGDVHHLLLCRIHASLRRHALGDDHANDENDGQQEIGIAR